MGAIFSVKWDKRKNTNDKYTGVFVSDKTRTLVSMYALVTNQSYSSALRKMIEEGIKSKEVTNEILIMDMAAMIQEYWDSTTTDDKATDRRKRQFKKQIREELTKYNIKPDCIQLIINKITL